MEKPLRAEPSLSTYMYVICEANADQRRNSKGTNSLLDVQKQINLIF